MTRPSQRAYHQLSYDILSGLTRSLTCLTFLKFLRSSCWIGDADDKDGRFVSEISRRIEAITGLSTNKNHAESLQVGLGSTERQLVKRDDGDDNDDDGGGDDADGGDDDDDDDDDGDDDDDNGGGDGDEDGDGQ